MKKITVSIASIIFLLVGYACKDSFLEVAPTGSLSKAQLTSKAGLDGSLISAYAQLSALGQKHLLHVSKSCRMILQRDCL